MNSDKACVDALTLPVTHEELKQNYNFSDRIPQVLPPDLEQRNYHGKFARHFFSSYFNFNCQEKK